nr:MAG TPA: hypothetical protein [Caudoviricetes sp.]
MQKAIHTDGASVICRILSITDVSATETSPNGLPYIAVNYVEPPELTDAMKVSYPMYNKNTGEMFWQVVDYQNSATELLLDNQNLRLQVSQLQQENKLLTAQISAVSDRNDFMEDCVAEMAAQVYA